MLFWRHEKKWNTQSINNKFWCWLFFSIRQVWLDNNNKKSNFWHKWMLRQLHYCHKNYFIFMYIEWRSEWYKKLYNVKQFSSITLQINKYKIMMKVTREWKKVSFYLILWKFSIIAEKCIFFYSQSSRLWTTENNFKWHYEVFFDTNFCLSLTCIFSL